VGRVLEYVNPPHTDKTFSIFGFTFSGVRLLIAASVFLLQRLSLTYQHVHQ